MTDTANDITIEQPGQIIPIEGTVYDLVLLRVKRRAERRIAWLRKLWLAANEKSAGDKPYNYHAEVDGCLTVTDIQDAEQNWYKNEASVFYLNEVVKNAENKLNSDQQSRFAKLVNIFCLTDVEKDMLQACLALYLEPNLGRVYAYLQDHTARSYVTTQLVARLFEHGQFLSIGASSPLFIWGLVVESDMGRSEPPRLDCDPFIRNWLLGSDEMDGHLAGIASLQTVPVPLESWPVNEKTILIKKLLEKVPVVRMFIDGDEGAGKRSFAAAVAAQLNRQLLVVQSSRITASQWPALYMHAQREAWLKNYALLWQGSIALENYWPVHIAPCSVQFITGDVKDAILPEETITDIRFSMPAIPLEEACRLWQNFLPASANWPKKDLVELVKRQQPAIGMIKTVSKTGAGTAAEASELLRSACRQRLGNLAQLMNSSFTWNDLVVPVSLRKGLDDLYFEATERATVWQNGAIKKHFPQGRGLIALFTGSPGTGKTMAAQVIANNLKLDLFRIDLSAVVSKYVGETSKNIERILSRAAGMNAVLLFDEADSLFGKRTDVKDAHDRFANTDTNYLLQAIEDYPGIAILATNQKGRIDNAFFRRLRYVLDFPKPDAVQRLQIWQKLVGELSGKKNAAVLEQDMIRLSELLEVTGAQVKQSILSAIFFSRREKKTLSTTHLLKGLEQELAKENRGIGSQARQMMQ